MHFSNTEDPHATAFSVMSPPPLTSVTGMQLQKDTAVAFAFVISVCGRGGQDRSVWVGRWVLAILELRSQECPEKEALDHSPVIAELLLCTRQTPSDPFSAEALKPLAGQGGP